jgi:hypothetical protein
MLSPPKRAGATHSVAAMASPDTGVTIGRFIRASRYSISHRDCGSGLKFKGSNRALGLGGLTMRKPTATRIPMTGVHIRSNHTLANGSRQRRQNGLCVAVGGLRGHG